MKRTFTLMIAIFAVLVLGTAAFATHVFPDVADDNTHSNSIEWASDSGVVVGYENGNFGPEDNITRGQAASMFYNYNDTLEDIAGPQGPAGVDGSNGANGSDGADGVNGSNGSDGADGSDGVSGYWVEGPEVRWSNGPGTVTATCPDDKVALGGGFTVQGIRGGSATITSSQPVLVSQTETTGWIVTGEATGEANVKAWATCADVTPAS